MSVPFVRNGDVFAGYEFFLREMVSHLIVVVAGNVVVECPVVTGAMNEMTQIIGLAGSKSNNPACLAMFSP